VRTTDERILNGSLRRRRNRGDFGNTCAEPSAEGHESGGFADNFILPSKGFDGFPALSFQVVAEHCQPA
jgi:hypothetical protein